MSDDADNLEDPLDFELDPLDESAETFDTKAEEEELDQEAKDAQVADELAVLHQRIHDVEALVLLPSKFPNPFIAAVNSANTFTELCILNGTASAFADGRGGTAISLGAGQSVIMEVRDDPVMRFVVVGGGSGSAPTTPTGTPGTGGLVLIKADGVAANYPTYSVYAITDVGLTTPLITGSDPKDARWRGAAGLDLTGGLTAAPDGSIELAGYDSNGDLTLITAAETVCTSGFTLENY